MKPLISTHRKKVLPSNYFLGNNYSPNTYLLVNTYSLQKISTPLGIVWSVLFSRLNTPGSSIFLGNTYSLVKPLYWNKRKQPFKGFSLNRCSQKVNKIFEKYLWKSSWFSKVAAWRYLLHICRYFSKIWLKLRIISF